jgi:hypothetical protein
MVEKKSNKNDMKEKVDKVVNDIKGRIDDMSDIGKNVRKSADDMAKNTAEAILSFLPEETQKHIMQMNKEALLSLKAMIDDRIRFIDQTSK